MHRTTRLTALALVAAAALPVAAPVAGAAVHTPQTLSRLAGSPQIRDVAGGTGTLHFATFVKVPLRPSGAVEAVVTSNGGQVISHIRQTGRHGTDFVYSARVRHVHAGDRPKLTFRLGSGKLIVVAAKAYDH